MGTKKGQVRKTARRAYTPRKPRKKVIRFEKIGGMTHALYTDRKMPKNQYGETRTYRFNIDIYKTFGIRRK